MFFELDYIQIITIIIIIILTRNNLILFIFTCFFSFTNDKDIIYV